jgi:hypothetical protein
MQIIFSIDTEHGTYTDALNLSDDITYSDVEIEAMKQERVNNWIAIITTPSEEIVETPTEEVTE